MTDRLILLIGDISEESFENFCEQLLPMELESKECVEIHLLSHGGSAYAALAFYSRIRQSPCKINITAFGFVASAATLILAAGDYRSMTEEAWAMVHEDSDKVQGEVHVLERDIKQMRKLEDQWNKLLEHRTGTNVKRWEKLNRQTTYLTADQCLELGLVDKILTYNKNDSKV